jgi:hypothetical protein
MNEMYFIKVKHNKIVFSNFIWLKKLNKFIKIISTFFRQLLVFYLSALKSLYLSIELLTYLQ